MHCTGTLGGFIVLLECYIGTVGVLMGYFNGTAGARPEILRKNYRYSMGTLGTPRTVMGVQLCFKVIAAVLHGLTSWIDLLHGQIRTCVFCVCVMGFPHRLEYCTTGVLEYWSTGATWASRTASAPWGRRQGHTSMIDAAGAMYVIGGYGSGGVFKDVWVSSDGGARPDSAGVLGGRYGVLRCGTRGVLKRY